MLTSSCLVALLWLLARGKPQDQGNVSALALSQECPNIEQRGSKGDMMGLRILFVNSTSERFFFTLEGRVVLDIGVHQDDRTVCWVTRSHQPAIDLTGLPATRQQVGNKSPKSQAKRQAYAKSVTLASTG